MHATIPNGTVGAFEVTLLLRILKVAREAMDVCLRVLKESNKGRFDSYSVRNSVLVISHITFLDYRVQIFSKNLSRNSCIQPVLLHTHLPRFIIGHFVRQFLNEPTGKTLHAKMRFYVVMC